jgi:hypothetical protein
MNGAGEGRGGGGDRRLEGSLSGHALLEGEWESLGLEDERDRAVALHNGLISLRSALASVELRLGAWLALFAKGGRFTFEPLGHATRESGCAERLGFSWSLARQLIDIARGVASLPRTREAFLLGLVERSKLRALLKVATPETEAGWLALARKRGEKQLAADVKAFQAGELDAGVVRAAAPSTPEVREEDRVYVRLSGSPAQAAAVRSWVVDVVRKVAGDSWLSASECLEHLCANAASGMDFDLPEAAASEDRGSSRQVRAVRLDDATLRDLGVKWRVQQVARPLELPMPGDDVEFDDAFRALMRCVRMRQQVLAERASLLHWLDGRSLWRHLGASSLACYAGRALGMPPKDLRESLRIRVRLTLLPELRAEWQRGVVPTFAARLLANIAVQDTEEEWLAHFAKCTGKRLDAETRWQDLALHVLELARWRETTDGGKPQPSRAMQELRQGIEAMARGCVQDLDADAPEVRAVIEVRPPLSSFGFWAPPEAAALVRLTLNEVRAGMAPTATDCDAILELTEKLLDEVTADRPKLSGEMRINWTVFERDGWQCTNPHCRSRRNLHAHHVEFRSHGGCDEKWNKTTLCAACHLRILHERFMRITRARPAPAEDFIFEFPQVGERWQEGLRMTA